MKIISSITILILLSLTLASHAGTKRRPTKKNKAKQSRSIDKKKLKKNIRGAAASDT